MTSLRETDTKDTAAAGGGGGPMEEPPPQRRSTLLRSIADAFVSDTDTEGPSDRRRSRDHTRRTRHRLSVDDQLKIRKTSMILTNPQAHALVLTHCEKTRLERLQELCFRSNGRRTSHSNGHNRASVSTSSGLLSETSVGDFDATNSEPAASTPVDATRLWLRDHIKTRPFRALLYSVILTDVVALAMDERTGDTITWFTVLDVVCTLLLFVEIALKCFAYGVFHGRNAYFTRRKLVVRMLNVLLLVLGLLSHVIGYKWRVLRGLKTYRCLTLYAGLRRILRSLARAIPFLANVATLALFFLFAFSIFGLEAYKGSYDRQCVFDDIQEDGASDRSTLWTAMPRMFCSSNATCLAPMACSNVGPPSRHVNFDSGLSALFLVFLVVAQDGWVTDIMEPVVEATSHLSALFFVAIVASMVFLVVNLFVAVITTSFMNFSVESARAREQLEGDDDGDGDGEGTGTHKVRGSMLKMDPQAEDTRVSLIMGATLALEESIQSQQPEDPSRKGVEEPKSPIATMLARTHKYRSLRNLTVDATRELIQNATPVEEFLARTAMTAKPNTVIPIPEDQPVEDLEIDQAAGAATRRVRTSTSISMSSMSSMAATSRRPTKLADAVNISGTVTSLTNVLDPASPQWLQHLQRIVLSKRYDDFITGCIVVNTGFLLVEFRDMSAWIKTMLSVAEYFFATIFLVEMLLRIVALRGLRRYLTTTERWFDFIVVICTSGNLVLNNLPNNSTFSGLNSVSSLRTLRVTRLMMKWEGTRKLIESVRKSSRGVMDVVAFLILFQVVNSIVAMQLFGGGGYLDGGDDSEPPRWNFDTFLRSFLTLLQVITADQWSSITYDAVNAANPHMLLVPFLIIIFIIGQYVLLNLFIAVILENFSISEEEAYQLQLEQIIAIPKELDIYEKIEEEGVRAFGEMEQLDNVSNVKLRMFLGLDGGGGAGGGDGDGEVSNNSGRMQQKAPSNGVVTMWRRMCRRVVRSRLFQRIVQVMILVSCLTLVLDDPHPEIQTEPPDERLVLALNICNNVALCVFVVEFIVKVGASGFGFAYLRMLVFHRDDKLGFVKKQAYIEDKWNQLDCVLLLLTVSDTVISQFDDSMRAARMFRAGRVLRPLRILNHNHEMKLILSAVAQSLPHVGNVFGLCILVYIIFGVVGRSLFSGMFFSCNDSSVSTMDECVGFYSVELDGALLALQEASARSVQSGAILVPRVWSNARFSFDNIGAAFLTLLEMTSLKWIDKTFAAMDITGTNKQPEQDHAPQNALFFVLFVYIGSLFVIRLFVGVLVEQFQRNNGTQILTESQKSWVDLEKFVLLLKPMKRIPRPTTTLQDKLYDLCQHRYFSRGIAVAILLNVALLLFNPSKTSSTTTTTTTTTESESFQVIEMLFLAVFTTEAALKCLAFRHHYVLSPAGAFELLILGGSLVAYFLATGIHGLIQTGRVFRMMRVLRFVRLNRGVYAVFQTFRASLKPIGHIFFLLFMIFFIFAIVGRQLFGGVRYGASLNRFSNFRSFGSSFLLLFQIMAGDDWHLTMTDCMLSEPFCVERTGSDGKLESDCGNSAAAVVYFVTYVTLVVFFLLNLFIAVVLENFRSCYLQGDVCPISLQDFESYREVFMNYDVNNSGTFPLWQLASFLRDLPGGLRIDSNEHRTAFLQIRSQVQALQETWAQQRCRRPFFNELLRMLCIHQLGIRCLPYEQQRDRVKQIFIYRAKVADMLVESVVKGYVQRWRRRKDKDKMAMLRSKMTPEAATLAMRRVSVDEDTSVDVERVRRRSTGSVETIQRVQAIMEAVNRKPRLNEEGEFTSETVNKDSERGGEANDAKMTLDYALMAMEVVKGAVSTAVVNFMSTGASERHGPDPPAQEPQEDKSHHKHKHKKHKKHKHKRKGGDGEGLHDADEGLVRKSARDDEPLHAPRRLPRLTHKVVPT